MSNDYSYHLVPEVRNQEMIDDNDQRILSPGIGVGRPGFGYGGPGYGFGRPGVGYGRPGYGFVGPGVGLGLGFLGGLATGALLAPRPGYGYYRPYPYYPAYPAYPYYYY